MPSYHKFLSIIVLFTAAVFSSRAQEARSQEDSLVRLISAQSMELVENNGADYRKVTGPARFLHNNTFLLCDTAFWYVNTNEIVAVSNVKILQDQTVLTGDKLTYYVDRDLAEFRGTLVQLEDKDHNTLRTRYLDYNTKDSVGTFFNGGAMRDKDGQIIESMTGVYDSKIRTFTFSDNVNMFTDSIFIRSTKLVYDSGRNVATFGYQTDAWREDNMLSSDAGWYDRNREIFFFRENVHGLSQDQEAWSDSLYFYRNTSDIEMLGRAQITDTTRNVFALGGRIEYVDTLSRIKMTRQPAVVGINVTDGEEPKRDTTYFGGDTLLYWTMPMCDIAQSQVTNAEKRLSDLQTDAVQTYRRKAAKEAAEAAAKAAENDPNRPPQQKQQNNNATQSQQAEAEQNNDAQQQTESKPKVATQRQTERENAGRQDSVPDLEEFAPSQDTLSVAVDSIAAGADSLYNHADSLGAVEKLPGMLDSLAVQSDSLSVQTESMQTDPLTAALDTLSVPVDSLVFVDSTKVGFIQAISNVKLFREDMQIACDSLEYCDLDSLVRLYRSPVIWNEVKRQYSADSLFAVVKNNRLEKASLMSNAFVIVQEDERCYDQIRAAEILAYFDSTGVLKRFDALGEANAVFYLEEDSVLATVNKSQAKMLYATFRDGQLEKVYYFDTVGNDAYPVAQLTNDERVLKGFNWLPDKRPKDKYDIIPFTPRVSERKEYESRPRAKFEQTEIYFPGYMASVYKDIEQGKAASSRRKEEQRQASALNRQRLDSLVNNVLDSILVEEFLSDSLIFDIDTTTLVTGVDTLSLDNKTQDARTGTAEPTAQEIKAAKRAEKAAKRAARVAAREARWARLDSLDAARAQAKADKLAEKQRAKKLKVLENWDRQDAKAEERLNKYVDRYTKQKAREDAKKASSQASKKAKKTKDKAAVESPADSVKVEVEDILEKGATVVEKKAEDVPELLPLPEKKSEALPVRKETVESKSESGTKSEEE